MIIILKDILYKTVVYVIGTMVLLFIKPIRKRVWKYIMKKLGEEKYKVIVTGKIFEKSNSRIPLHVFKVELPLKDISEDSIPIDDSNYYIIQEINKEYGKRYDIRNYSLNNISVKEITYYPEMDMKTLWQIIHMKLKKWLKAIIIRLKRIFSKSIFLAGAKFCIYMYYYT